MTKRKGKSENTKKQLKIHKLQEELREKTKFAENILNQLKYLQADFENYKKRVEKERKIMTELANESLIKELLPILDDLEEALKSVKNEKDKEGLTLLYRKFFKILEDYGLRRIEALGKKFDPYYHEVILEEKSDKEEGTVLEEIQKGYLLNSKVIRHSKVKTAKNVKFEEGIKEE